MKKKIAVLTLVFCLCSPLFAQNYQSCIDEGDDFMRIGDKDQAMQWYEEAMRYRNEDPKALFLIGKIYEDKGDTDKASEYYERVLARSTDPYLTYEIGAFYFKIKDVARVEEIYTKAWRHRNSLIETNLGMGDYNFIIKNYRKAMEFYEFVIKRDDTRAIAYFRYAVCLDAAGKTDKAIEMCRQAMRLDGSEEIKKYYDYLKNKR